MLSEVENFIIPILPEKNKAQGPTLVNEICPPAFFRSGKSRGSTNFGVRMWRQGKRMSLVGAIDLRCQWDSKGDVLGTPRELVMSLGLRAEGAQQHLDR